MPKKKRGFRIDFKKDRQIKDVWFFAALAILLLMGIVILG